MADMEYYCPTIGIKAKELYDIVKNWVKLWEWEEEGFRLNFDNGRGYCSYQFEYKKESIEIIFSALDECSPICILSSVKRNRERVALRLAKILKIGDLEKVSEDTTVQFDLVSLV